MKQLRPCATLIQAPDKVNARWMIGKRESPGPAEHCMKTLFLIRHAKSSWDDIALPDKDRSLNDRGRRDAPKMGKRLAKRDVTPDLILSSPARRALTTKRAAAVSLDTPSPRDTAGAPDNAERWLAAAAPVQEIAVLHERFCEPLQRFFASFRLSSHDVEDLTQEVFLRLARPVHRDSLRQPDAFLFTLARNLVRDRARRLYTRAARSAVNLEDLDLSCELPTLEEFVEYEERLQDATQALEGLKSETRRAFIMHRVFRCSYAEIASDLGVSVSMIEKHIMCAIAALRPLDGLESSSIGPPRRVERPRALLPAGRAEVA
jgi:RNA polymerase sigma factor (sigma-70 family)